MPTRSANVPSATATQKTSCRAEPGISPEDIAGGLPGHGVTGFSVVQSLKSQKLEHLPTGPSPADGCVRLRGLSEKRTASENLTVERDPPTGLLDLRLTYD